MFYMEVKLFNRPVSLVTVFGEKVRVTPGVLEHFTSSLYNNNVNIYAVSTGEDSITFIVDYVDEEKSFAILKDAIKNGPTAFNELVLRSNKSLININASDFAEVPGVAAAAINGLAREKLNIIEVLSSYGNITLILEPETRMRAYELIVSSLKEFEKNMSK